MFGVSSWEAISFCRVAEQPNWRIANDCRLATLEIVVPRKELILLNRLAIFLIAL